MINIEGFKNEQHLRTMIKKNLNKEIHPNTRCSIDFINKLLNDAYDSNQKYDVTDMKNAVYAATRQAGKYSLHIYYNAQNGKNQ